MSVRNVGGEPSVTMAVGSGVRESTVGTSPVTARSVEKASPVILSLLDIRESTLERDLMHVMSVAKALEGLPILANISIFTQEKNFILVKYVDRPLICMKN